MPAPRRSTPLFAPFFHYKDCVFIFDGGCRCQTPRHPGCCVRSSPPCPRTFTACRACPRAALNLISFFTRRCLEVHGVCVTFISARFVYYLSKYWELLDSLFQVQKAQSLGSKGSPPSFLHYYHHAAVLVSPIIPAPITPHTSLPPAPGHVLELDRVQPDPAVAGAGIQHFCARHHVSQLHLYSFYFPRFCLRIEPLLPSPRAPLQPRACSRAPIISPPSLLTTSGRYAYYAFTVYKPAPRPLKMLITQVKRHRKYV